MNEDIDTLVEGGSDEKVLFEQDKGTLPLAHRKLMVLLLNGPFIDAQKHPKVWADLIKHQEAIRTRMHDLFLDLIVDTNQGVAFLRQVQSNSLEVPVLLKKYMLTFFESALLLHLRKVLTTADSQGDRAVVDLQEMREYLKSYARDGNTDLARFEKQVASVVEKLRKLNLLTALKSDDNRYEISPTLKLLFPVESITQLQALYEQHKARLQGDASSSDDQVTEEQL